MREKLELHRLSLTERDRRWKNTRDEMRKRGLDALVLWGWPAVWDFCIANSRYLCPVGGNSEFNVLVFPLEGEPTCFVQMPTFVEGWKRSQEWVPDIRPRVGTWAESVAGRIREMGLQKSRIGMDGTAGPLDPDGWVPYSVYVQTKEQVPEATFVELVDMMEKLRAVKSAEEIAVLDKAAAVGDMMLATCAERARPGVRESEVYGQMMATMLAEGCEPPTLFMWNCDKHPFPHPFRVPTTRRMEAGDVIICEMHPKFGGYFTHVERTYSLGDPDPHQLRMYDGCIDVYNKGLELFGPGRKISECMETLRAYLKQQPFSVCETGIHGHGLASLEYPRYRLHGKNKDGEVIKATGDEFLPGMVFAYIVDLFDATWQKDPTGVCFAETIVITETGVRRMHKYPMDFQILKN